MPPSPYPLLKKPVSLWEQHFQVDGKGLFKAVTSAVVHAVTDKKWELIGDAASLIASLSTKKETGEVAWILTRRALERAMLAIAFEANLPLAEALPRLKSLAQQADEALNSVEVELSPDFFSQPRQMPVLAAIQPPFTAWLRAGGAQESDANAAAARLPGYFVFALGEEWNSAPAVYAETLAATKHPFAQAGEWEMAWIRYNGHLQQQIDTGLFDMPFSLRQLYVPLRGSYPLNPASTNEDENTFTARTRDSRQNRSADEARALIGLTAELDDWVKKGRADDAIRLIRGGPGSGKSSFLKVYAAHRAETQDAVRVLFIPLHLIDHKGDLEQAVGTFLRESKFLPANPLSADSPNERLLLLFDGLDELALQGKVGAEAASAFAQEVINKLNRRNAATLQVQAILSGRDVAVQACAEKFRGAGKVLTVEPYLIDAKEFKQQHTADLSDQRTTWWKNYGERMGLSYEGMPSELQNNDKLDEITKWPLLNHLVALSYEGANRDFSNLNTVYRSLLHDVYERAYEKKQHKSISDLQEDQFLRVLEEIALAAWHGRGRTTTAREIEEHCLNASLGKLLDQFQSDQKKERVAHLLLAFYFRQAGTTVEGDAAYEFTHKSFGEYLTACRLVRGIGRLHRQLRAYESDVDSGWNEKQALVHWAELCGPTPMDTYVLQFLRDEVALHPKEVTEWLSTLTTLLNYSLRNGLPIEECKIRTYKEMVFQARNVSESLLAALNACVRADSTQQIVRTEWRDRRHDSTFARAFLESLRGENYGRQDVFLDCLTRLDFSRRQLRLSDLRGADLRGANLQDTYLQYANLQDANLREANLQDAYLQRANLQGADLYGADLRRVNLQYADLYGANLYGADLYGADLYGANLQEANLQEANLQDVDLTDCYASDETVWPSTVTFGGYTREYINEPERVYRLRRIER